MAEPERKTSKQAWKDFQEKLHKYIGEDQPIEFVYAIRDMMSRVVTSGVPDDYVNKISDKYRLRGEDKERLLELKQKWDLFERRYAKLKEKYKPVIDATSKDQVAEDQRERFDKWRTKRMQKMHGQFAAMQGIFKISRHRLDSNNAESLAEFRVDVDAGLGEIKTKDAVQAKEDIKAKQDEIKTSKSFSSVSPRVQSMLINNDKIDLDKAEKIQKIYNNVFAGMGERRHPKEIETRKAFNAQAKEEKLGVKLSKYEFGEMWNGTQQRLANNAKGKIQDLAPQAVKDTGHQDYRRFRQVLRVEKSGLKKMNLLHLLN